LRKNRSIEVGIFDAVLGGLILPMGLRVQSVKLSGVGLKCSYPPFAAESEKPGILEVFVSEADLADFLNKMSPAGLKNVSVEAKGGLLHIRATKTVLIDVKAYAICSLRIVDAKQLFVDLQSVDIMGAGPKQLIQSQLDKINPVVDTTDFPFVARLNTVEVAEGGILLKGTIAPDS
jgi:hypothetical protein